MDHTHLNRAQKTQRQEATDLLIAQEGRLLRSGATLALVEWEFHSAALSVKHAREKLRSSGPPQALPTRLEL